jgi:hypothetical protein
MARTVIEPILITDPERRRAGTDIDVELLARLMDSVFWIPGMRVRFGLDAVIGLIPGLGDTLTSFVSLYILKVASLAGVPRVTLVRMALNIAIDYVVGTVPLVGDVFDVYWKANLKNVELLQRHLLATPAAERRGRSGDWLFVAGLGAALIALLIGCITIAWWIATSLWQLLGFRL